MNQATTILTRAVSNKEIRKLHQAYLLEARSLV